VGLVTNLIKYVKLIFSSHNHFFYRSSDKQNIKLKNTLVRLDIQTWVNIYVEIMDIFIVCWIDEYEVRTLFGLVMFQCRTQVDLWYQQRHGTYDYTELCNILKLLSVSACRCPCLCSCFIDWRSSQHRLSPQRKKGNSEH